MSKKARYILLACGFLAFLILAPLLVMYVGGWVYNPQSKTFVKTGILAVRIDPSDGKIFINGKLKKSGSGDIKFLLPDNYDLGLKKQGYFDWNKRLPVVANQVTWANPGFSNVYLFLNNPQTQNLSSQILDFDLVGSQLYYLSPGNLSISDSQNNNNTENYTLPSNPKNITASPNGRLALLTGPGTILLFDKESKKITDLTNNFSSTVQFTFSPQNDLYALENETLSRYSLGNKQTIFQNVKTYGFLQDSLYYIKENNNSNELVIADTASAESQILSTNLPTFTQGKLFITYDKQIFLLADGSLYHINASSEKLADNVSDIGFDKDQPALIYVHNGQLDFYNFSSHQTQFITRSEQLISQPNLPQQIGYSLFALNNNLTAIELDTRDHQNQYELYAGSNLKKIILNKNGSRAWLLDGMNLKFLHLR